LVLFLAALLPLGGPSGYTLPPGIVGPISFLLTA